MSDIYEFDVSAGNNNAAPPNGFPENMEYEEVNDASRELMAAMRRWQAASFGGIESAGTQPAYTLTSGQTFAAYENGMSFAFLAHASSTGNVTLNVDGKGAVAVRDSRGNQLGSGDIVAGGIYFVVKVAASWRLVGHLAAASVATLASNTLSQAYTTGGTSNAFTITASSFPAAYANGQLIAFVADRANTGAATLNINGLGAEALEDIDSAALAANDIVTGQVMLAARVSDEWRIFAGAPINLATQVVGTLAVANGGTGATDASGARTALGVGYASDANVRAAASGVVLQTSQLESAAAPVALTDASTIAVDWDTGINFTVTLGDNRTLGNPTNGQPGTWRRVQVTQDGTGSRTLATSI
jgi:hypothetical protein